MKLFERFDKVYCVNLEKRNDRLLKFETQVKDYDLGNFKKFVAYDGSKLDKTIYKTNLKSSELGLILSNLDIIKESIENGYQKILILEDDCYFTDEVKNIDSYFDFLPDDWDMLYMGGNHNTHVGCSPPKIINEKVIKLHNTFSTHFIGIKSTLFPVLMNVLSRYSDPLDVSYARIQKSFNVYSFYPAIAKQIVDYSDIQNKITDYNWLIK